MQLPVTASSLEQAEEAVAGGYHGLEHEVSIRCGGRRGNGISVAGGLVVTLGGRPGAGITVGYRLPARDAHTSIRSGSVPGDYRIFECPLGICQMKVRSVSAILPTRSVRLCNSRLTTPPTPPATATKPPWDRR